MVAPDAAGAGAWPHRRRRVSPWPPADPHL